MRAVVDARGKVHALVGDAESWSGPEGFRLVDAGGFEPSGELADYRWDGSGFALDGAAVAEREAGEEAARQVGPAVAALLASAAARLSDAEAASVAALLPEVDPSRRYAEGEVARHDGRAVRKTATGWRRLG